MVDKGPAFCMKIKKIQLILYKCEGIMVETLPFESSEKSEK